jgi:hypothetical protein
MTTTKPNSIDDEDILNFMLANMHLSPRECAAHFGIPFERVRDILQRDLAEVMRGQSERGRR